MRSANESRTSSSNSFGSVPSTLAYSRRWTKSETHSSSRIAWPSGSRALRSSSQRFHSRGSGEAGAITGAARCSSSAPEDDRNCRRRSRAERIRAESRSVQLPSLALLFTGTLGRSLGPLAPAEEEPATAGPGLRRLEAVRRLLLLVGARDRGLRRLDCRLGCRLDHRLLVGRRRRRRRDLLDDFVADGLRRRRRLGDRLVVRRSGE